MTATQISAWEFGATDVVAVSGSLDFAASVQLRLALYEQIDDGARDVVVDLSGASLIDASTVGVLLTAQQQLHERGGDLRLQGANARIQEVLEVSGAAKALLAGRRPDDDTRARAEDANAEPRGHSRWGEEVDAMLSDLTTLPPGHLDRAAVRERLIEACLPHAERLARRFYGLGEPTADLNQVAALGLVKAVDRFDARFGTDLARYAASTIVGELKRHFRDRGWSVQVPRRLKDLRLEINQASAVLIQGLGHAPTAREVSDYLDVDEKAVLEALVAANGYRATSLLAPVRSGAATTAPVHWLGTEDARLTAVEDREVLQALLAALPAREQKIVILRFYGNQTQAQIADQLGISQMHVSRLLSRILDQLREALLGDG